MHSDLIGVLTDGANAPHVEAALRVLLQGCTEGPDLQLQRQCFLILHRLVEEWCGGGLTLTLTLYSKPNPNPNPNP